MQRSNLQMVIVVDEFGGTAGLVTLADLIRTLIGEESETTDPEEAPFVTIDEHTFLVSAQMNIEQLNELLDLDLPLTDLYQTLGGFLIYKLQKIPTVGESLQYNNLDLTLVKAIGPRLYQIRIRMRSRNSSNNPDPDDRNSISPPNDEETESEKSAED